MTNIIQSSDLYLVSQSTSGISTGIAEILNSLYVIILKSANRNRLVILSLTLIAKMTATKLTTSLSIVLLCNKILLSVAQPPTQSPTFAPTAEPSFQATASPSNPTYSPTLAPTPASQIFISDGAMAAAVILATFGSMIIFLMLFYIFRAPNGSSPGSYFFPAYYMQLYPDRPLYSNRKEFKLDPISPALALEEE